MPNVQPMMSQINHPNLNQNGLMNGYNGPMINVNPIPGDRPMHSSGSSGPAFQGGDFR